VADWQTISSLATAGGTLVLAVATFSAVRSSNRSARVAETALLTGMRPLLLPSLRDDPDHKVLWVAHVARLSGGQAIAEQDGTVIYFAIGLRDCGASTVHDRLVVRRSGRRSTHDQPLPGASGE